MAISVEQVCVNNSIVPDYMSSELALEEHEIDSTRPDAPIDNNCMDDKLHFGMPGGSREIKESGDASDKQDAIPTGSW